MLPLLRSELFRLRRRPMTWWLILIIVIAVGGIYAIFWGTLATSDATENLDLRQDARPASVRDTGLDLVNFFASILTVIISASIVGTEYGWGTIRALLPRARSRLALLGAKLTALALFNLVIIGVGFLVAWGMSTLIARSEDLPRGPGPDGLEELGLALVRNFYVLLPYTALAFFVAVLTRSNAAGITIGLVILFAESIAVSIITELTNAFDWLGDVLFSQNMNAISNLNNLSGGSDSDLPGAGQAAIVLALWIIGLVALSLTIFQRRDVTSG